MTGLRDGQRRNRGWISGKGKRFISSLKFPDRLWDPLTLLFSAYRGKSGRRVKLTSQLHLLRRLKLSGSIPPPPHVPERFAHALPFFTLYVCHEIQDTVATRKGSFFCHIMSSDKILSVPNGSTRFSPPSHLFSTLKS